jgi:hypothetical protein
VDFALDGGFANGQVKSAEKTSIRNHDVILTGRHEQLDFSGSLAADAHEHIASKRDLSHRRKPASGRLGEGQSNVRRFDVWKRHGG